MIPRSIYRNPAFLGLPSDTHRLVFLALWQACDDFGNIESGTRNLLWWAMDFCQVRSEGRWERLINALCAADMIRLYAVGATPYLHLPLFENRRTYARRIAPPSPWCDPDAPTGPYKAGFRRMKLDSRPAAILSGPMSREVEGFQASSESENPVEVGFGSEGHNQHPGQPTATRIPRDWELPDEWRRWSLNYVRAIGAPVTGGQIVEFAETFWGFWHDKQGPKALRIDWFGTWRAWFSTWALEQSGKPSIHSEVAETADGGA